MEKTLKLLNLFHILVLTENAAGTQYHHAWLYKTELQKLIYFSVAGYSIFSKKVNSDSKLRI